MQPPVQTGDVYQGELDNDNAGLGRVLFEKVAQAASLAWKRCYAAKTEITHKTLSPLKNIHQKLVGLTFVEPKVAPVAELIAMAMQEIPRRGAIRGGMLTRLQSLVCMLCDPNLMQSHGQRMLEGKTGAGVSWTDCWNPRLMCCRKPLIWKRETQKRLTRPYCKAADCGDETTRRHFMKHHDKS